AFEDYLLVQNHLGATLRSLGRLEEAHVVFTAAIKKAGSTWLRARGRLLGNLGALLDEFGQRAHADDSYARYDELMSAFNDPHRIANARGLVGRSAELRGDYELAARYYKDEFEYAKKVGDKARQIAALM